jgi:alkanesulfonate monooxygenase SsuD/methylene tetrahydromethanopterin reductase-like flavin-dependent oxidoreductase (luciferase family)
LRLGLAADAARYADVFDVQSQRFERDTERYARFVREAAAQAREANPKVMVLAGVSTQPSGQHVTADDILRAIDATRDFVDGYWFNIPEPSEYSPAVTEFRPDIAVDVLRQLAGR